MSRNAALIAGGISMLIGFWFLGWLVVSINVLPLWIIIGTTLGMMLYDFYDAMKDERSSSDRSGSQNGA